ncbi:MAG: hypothetical protein CL940_06850 [Deltaproteobacteria bacterium]|nr:hypothetical protein [Deltaproteobacteria bacterium]
MGRTVALLGLLCVGLVPSAQAQVTDAGVGDRDIATCRDALGRTPVVEQGREGDVRALLSPHVVGKPVGESAWTLDKVSIDRAAITVHLLTAQGEARLVLRPAVCHTDAKERSLSFAMERFKGPGEASPDAALDALVEAIQSQDQEAFYRVRMGAAPPAHVQEASAPEGWKTLALTGGLVWAGILGLFVGLFGVWRARGAAGSHPPIEPRTWWLLAAFVLLAAGLRFAVDPVFLREAYPLASVGHLERGVRWSAPLTVYPRGQWLLVAGLRPLLPASPYDAWFLFNQLQGILTIPAAFFALRALTGRAAVGLTAAALLACWPQHVRFSASEATHIGLVLWAFLALGWTARAARTGTLTDFVAAATSAAMMVTMRPEAGLWGPGLLALGFGVAPKAMEAMKRPTAALVRLLIVGALLGLLIPQLLVTGADATTLGPAADSPEALDMDSLLGMPRALFLPTEFNAFFDPSTAPVWLWPLAWIPLIAARVRADRAAAWASMGTILLFFVLYVKMPPAVTLWAMGRYHLAALPAVVILVSLGLEWIVARVLKESAERRLPWISGGVALVGIAACWGSITALPYDWQQEQAWLVERGKERPRLFDDRTRLVTPDNRRRFGDMAPREAIFALGETHRLTEEVVTIEHALRGLNVGSRGTPALYYEGLYCHLALAPGETTNPQCDAMHQAFELEPIAHATVDRPSYLLAYADQRPARELPITLYRVGARRLEPNAALRLLPQPVEHGDDSSGSLVMGTSTRASTAPPVPPLNR